eukprot:2311973-Pleurochrysis_carterae.AAC.1
MLRNSFQLVALQPHPPSLRCGRRAAREREARDEQRDERLVIGGGVRGRLAEDQPAAVGARGGVKAVFAAALLSLLHGLAQLVQRRLAKERDDLRPALPRGAWVEKRRQQPAYRGSHAPCARRTLARARTRAPTRNAFARPLAPPMRAREKQLKQERHVRRHVVAVGCGFVRARRGCFGS